MFTIILEGTMIELRIKKEHC